MIHEITENSQTEQRTILKKAYKDCFQSGNSIGSGATVQEGSSLKAIRLTQLEACPK
jgi:hypothetical protein